MSKKVDHPPHYNRGKIEVIDFIEDQNLDFNRGNVIKYICRAGEKEDTDPQEDLMKAKWYLDRELEKKETSETELPPTARNINWMKWIAEMRNPSMEVELASPEVLASSLADLFAGNISSDILCQWNEIYFIGYSVVRLDYQNLFPHDLLTIDPNATYNNLVQKSYKWVGTHHITIKATEAIDPTKKLSNGWSTPEDFRGKFSFSYKRKNHPILGYIYDISFVRFMKYKV